MFFQSFAWILLIATLPLSYLPFDSTTLGHPRSRKRWDVLEEGPFDEDDRAPIFELLILSQREDISWAAIQLISHFSSSIKQDGKHISCFKCLPPDCREFLICLKALKCIIYSKGCVYSKEEEDTFCGDTGSCCGLELCNGKIATLPKFIGVSGPRIRRRTERALEELVEVVKILDYPPFIEHFLEKFMAQEVPTPPTPPSLKCLQYSCTNADCIEEEECSTDFKCISVYITQESGEYFDARCLKTKMEVINLCGNRNSIEDSQLKTTVQCCTFHHCNKRRIPPLQSRSEKKQGPVMGLGTLLGICGFALSGVINLWFTLQKLRKCCQRSSTHSPAASDDDYDDRIEEQDAV